MKVLMAWVGLTDVRASEGTAEAGLGPIGQAIRSRNFDRILLLSNLDKKQNSTYQKWLVGQTKTPIEMRIIKLSSPTEFGEIYKAVVEILAELSKKIRVDLSLTYHLSPGTPAMAAV